MVAFLIGAGIVLLAFFAIVIAFKIVVAIIGLIIHLIMMIFNH